MGVDSAADAREKAAGQAAAHRFASCHGGDPVHCYDRLPMAPIAPALPSLHDRAGLFLPLDPRGTLGSDKPYSRRGFLTLEAISGHFVEFSHPTGARSGILTIFCFWRRVLNAVRVSRPEKAVLVEAMWSVHCLFLQMACWSLRNRA
ncbi:hypothetical protein S101468_02637 [Acetobacter pasteurianus subsp. pasteurianus]|uniref:Uncharacterized protein n=1 Tax=Acetobacter pasteurianus subsp. pasteurianus TaxID=481145 RepID=A0AAC9SUE2_ACEPA|nr:hypothetical protein S101468_02637 [Acetobacter pasteurianus subsp. pasteurianus]